MKGSGTKRKQFNNSETKKERENLMTTASVKFIWIVLMHFGTVPQVEMIDDFGYGTMAECEEYLELAYPTAPKNHAYGCLDTKE